MAPWRVDSLPWQRFPLLLALAACLAGPLASCRSHEVTAARATSAEAEPPAARRDDDELRPVYPAEAGPADPLAERLCRALHDIPEERRAACCATTPGLVVTHECIRTLSSALRSRAVAVDGGDVDRCAAAIEAAHAGCEWVGPFPPELPSECDGIVRGSLTVGVRCRSSLECRSGMRCAGAGPTSVGICAAPARPGEACGTAVDVLATYTRQVRVEAAHPPCDGYCDMHRCIAFVAPGAACASSVACGAGQDCRDGRCGARVMAKRGEACPGGSCEAGLRCYRGRCVAPGPAGAACASDFECQGGCAKREAGAGVCGRRCDVR